MVKRFRAAATRIALLLAVLLTIVPVISVSGAAVMQIQSQPYTWKNAVINGGGFITGILFHPSVQNLAYARTDIGGLYRWNQAAGRWVPLMDWINWDNWGYSGVWSVALDPNNANTVYAAVGMYTNGWDPNNGAVLKSTDQGNTWTVNPLPFKGAGNMAGRGCGERLAVDPNNSNILYLAATGDQATTYGLWKSTSGGTSWSQVTSFTAVGDWVEVPGDYYNYNNTYQGLWWVLFDKRFVTSGVTQNIYVGVATKNGPTVYRSTNGGTSWAALAGQPLADCGNNLLMPKKAALDTANGFLYIAYGLKAGPYDDGKGAVWKYNTATGAWTNIDPVADDCNTPGNGNPYYGYNGLAIDPQSPSTVMVTGYSSWWPDTFIYRSTNGGTSWSNIWHWTHYPNYVRECNQDISAAQWLDDQGTSGSRPPVVNPKLGWMTEALAIDPFNRNRFLYGTGAIMFGVDDALQWDDGNVNTKFTVKVYSIGIEETSVSRLLSPPSGTPHLLSGMYDIGGARHDNLDVAPNTYGTVFCGAHDIDFAESNPSIVFRVGKYASVASGDNPPHSAYSTNQGSTWATAGNLANMTGLGGGGYCCVNASGTTFIWSPEDDPTTDSDPTTNVPLPVSYTTSKGKTWTACAGVPSHAVVRADRVNANKIYAFKNGTFYRSTNGGASFTATTATGLPTTEAADFHAVPGREGDIWLAGGATGSAYGLWHSTDSGSTFTKLSNVSLADVVGFGMAATGQTYPTIYMQGTVSTIRGYYRSTDAGATWVRINDDAHQWYASGTKSITGDPRIYGRVYISTNGRGIIYGDPQ
ncbi:MAG TPA: xyloglucanase [Blastocatellia bacterium]|nr:xyloglucanase [Blastocatellia bacterium]